MGTAFFDQLQTLVLLSLVHTHTASCAVLMPTEPVSLSLPGQPVSLSLPGQPVSLALPGQQWAVDHQLWPCFASCTCEIHGHIRCQASGSFVSNLNQFNRFLLNTPAGRDSRVHFDLGDQNCIPDFITDLPAVRNLSLDGNRLSTLQSGGLRLPRLRELNLSHNALLSIDADALRGLDQLLVLDLSHNRLTIIARGVFASLPKLVQLDLNHNFLQMFPLDAGSYLPELQVLALGDNDLSFIMPGSLKALPSLKILEITRNKLRTLVVDIEAEVPSLQVLDVSQNPFHCSCALYGFHRLLDASGNQNIMTSLGSAICSSPVSSKGKLIKDVIKNLTNCTGPKSVFDYDTKEALYDSEINLYCDIQGDPDPAILWVTPWGHQFAHTSHRPQLEHVCETCKQERAYSSRGSIVRPHVAVISYGRQLRITNYRSYFDGNVTCHAYNYLGNSSAVIGLHVSAVVQKIVQESLKFGGFSAAGFLCFGLIVGSIKLAVLACLNHFSKKDVLRTPTNTAPYYLEECGSLMDGDGDICRHSADLNDYFYPPETPFTTPMATSPRMSPRKNSSPAGQESPVGGWRPSSILETMEEVRWRLRYGVDRKVQSMKRNVQSIKASGIRNVQSIKESGSVCVHNLMESSSSAALKVRAGVVHGVEAVKYHVQSIREFCGTGDMGMQTISMVSVETNLDTNETKEIVRSVTIV